MKFRSMILVLTIAFSAIFVSMLGTSYAYYVSTDGTNIDVTTGNIDTGTVVTFEEGQYININNAVPVNSPYGRGDVYVFTISFNEDILVKNDLMINVGLTDIYIDEELTQSDDFMFELWGFFEFDGNTAQTLIGRITGKNFTEEVLSRNFISLGSFDATSLSDNAKSIQCSLYVFLKETNENQNHLMNKKFRGLIKVNTLFK